MPKLSPVQRLVISIAIAVVATLIEIQILLTVKSTLLLFLSVAAYAALIPSIVVVVTLWEEVATSVVKLVARARRRERAPKPLYLSPIATSHTLYAVSRGPLHGLISWYAEMLSKRFRSADIQIDPLNFAALIAIASVCLGVSTALVSVLLIGLPLIVGVLAGLTLFLIVLAAPLAYASYCESARRGAIDMELPFFVVYATLVERAGKSLITAFERVAEQSHIFRRLSIEASIVRKILAFFRYSPVDALEEYASSVPNERMRSFVSGYTSIIRIGGNTASYLESVYQEMLNNLSNRWVRYVESASMLGDIIVALFMLFPTLLALGAIAFSQTMSVTMLQLFTYLATPFIAMGLYVMIDSMQPKLPSAPLFSSMDKAVALSGIGIAIPMYMALCCRLQGVNPLIVVCIALTIAILPELGIYMVRSAEVRSIESDLPKFVRDVAEFLRIGYNIPRAIAQIARSRRYNRFLDSYIGALAMLLQLNIPLPRIQRCFISRSWLFNYTLFVLSDLEQMGALTPRELDSLSSFLESIVNSRDQARKGLTLYLALSIMTPLFVLFLAMMSSSLISLMGHGVLGLPTSFAFVSPVLIKQIVEKTSELAIVLAIAMGVLAAKVRDGTGLNTAYAALSLILLTLVLYFWKELQTLIMTGLSSF